MKLLLINHYAGSDSLGMEYRPFYFGREWVAAGHQVTIIAADQSHLRGAQPKVSADLARTEEEGVGYRWIRTPAYYGNDVRRLMNMLSFVGKLWLHADRIAREERPDVVICSSTYPLDIYPGARIAHKARARLVFELHDLWPLTPILLGGYSPRHPYIRVLQRAEDFACRTVDMVVSILPHASIHLEARGLDRAKFSYVPNGVPVLHAPVEKGELPAAVQDLVRRERDRGRFLVGFAGGINFSTGIGELFEAARLLSASGVSFLVAGAGPLSCSLRERVERSSIDNFHMVGHLPKKAIQVFLSQADVLALSFRRNPLYRFGTSPNKLFDYMLAARPIVQASDASNDLVTLSKCGLTVEPENPAAMANAVSHLRALSAEERRCLGENGRRFVIANHDTAVLASRFLEAINAAPASQRHPTVADKRRPDVLAHASGLEGKFRLFR